MTRVSGATSRRSKHPQEGPGKPKTTSLDTWVRTPSGHPQEWDLRPGGLEELRARTTPHSSPVAPQVEHRPQGTSTPLDMCPPAPPPTDTNRGSSCVFTLCKHTCVLTPAIYDMCATLLAHRGGGFPLINLALRKDSTCVWLLSGTLSQHHAGGLYF